MRLDAAAHGHELVRAPRGVPWIRRAAASRRRADRSDNEAAVRVLLHNGADVGATADDAWTALHYSGKHGHSAVGSLLIQKGADINAQKVKDRAPSFAPCVGFARRTRG